MDSRAILSAVGRAETIQGSFQEGCNGKEQEVSRRQFRQEA